ncbi:hypothetical protein [Campylobacter sp. CNRCH_2014_0184h]|uniref:hypothetical protein n=1 Tax=Campylobacter sp. CNRCH_2014_0184h TaxID=2911602 RepID=UPI0021E683A7|nr:hypothetical protein [Campylobacter sp. CNRCH_2014_0184h]MCV3482140.1 hypothetical protein [Campylobacter sp. CNRCH_2014_0184h]
MELSLAEKVHYLEQIVIHNCFISRMALENKISLQTLQSIYSIFNFYSEKINSGDYNFTYADIEKTFSEIGINRVDLKSIILLIGETGQYDEVIKHYLKTNNDVFGNVSSEFLGLWRKYF